MFRNKHLTVLIILMLNIFLISSSNSFVLPFLPEYLTEYLGCEKHNLYTYATTAYSITYILSIFFAPLWGSYADTHGKRKMLLYVLCLLALSYFIAFMASSPLELILSRALQGTASGITPVLLTFAVLNAQKEEHRGISLGMLQSSNLIGTIVGAGLGGIVSEYCGIKYSFLMVFLFILPLIVLNYLQLHVKEPTPILKRDRFLGIINIFSDPILKSLSFCVFINSTVILMIVPIMTTLVSSLTELKEDLALTGFMFALSGLAGAIAAPLWSALGNKMGYLKVILAASLLSAIILIIMSHTYSLMHFFVLQFLFGLCICATIPSANAITAKHIDEYNRTFAMALLYSASQLGSFLGPILGFLILGIDNAHTVLAIGALMLIFVFSHTVLVTKIRKHSHETS